MPRAKLRSQTTPPSKIQDSTSTSTKSHHNNNKKSEKSKSIDESNSSDTDSSPTTSSNQFLDCATVINSIDSQQSSSNCCDRFNQNYSEKSPLEVEDLQDITKDQKNLNNFCTMSSQQAEKELILEDDTTIKGTNKIDKDEKELMKASQEINRSNRKLIKQTFNSNVLEIASASGSSEMKSNEKAVNEEDDDWDTL